MVAATASVQAGQFGPPTSIDLAGGNGPGVWPFYSVTGSNWDFSTVPGATIGGTGSDNIKATLLSAGPLNTQDVRHNEGDIALAISPFVPGDAYLYPDPGNYVDNYAPGGPGPETEAWRVNQAIGGLFASVRVNGHDNGDTTDGVTPVGTVYGISYFNADFGQGNSYHPLIGDFRNGGDGSSDLQMGILGSYSEAVIPTSTASLPYGQGWLGAWINGTVGVDDHATINEVTVTPFAEVDAVTSVSASPVFDATSITWDVFSALARVDLSAQGFSPDTGMLFVAPTNGDNNSKIAAASPRAGGWDVAIRHDNDEDSTNATAGLVSLNTSDAGFQMMYIDYDAPQLIGGHIDGSDGSSVNGAGTYTVARTGVGTYEIEITGKTGNDGMLMLSISDAHPGDATVAGRAIASYEYDSGSGNFIVETHELDLFDTVSFTDSDFNFAWVDFTDPFQPWIDGDVNIDGKVDGLDYLGWAANYGKTNDATWFEGDFDRDGDVTGLDYLKWAGNFGTDTNAAAVPEPSTMMLAGLGALAMAALRRRRV
jgi:hypothetical protein